MKVDLFVKGIEFVANVVASEVEFYFSDYDPKVDGNPLEPSAYDHFVKNDYDDDGLLFRVLDKVLVGLCGYDLGHLAEFERDDVFGGYDLVKSLIVEEVKLYIKERG